MLRPDLVGTLNLFLIIGNLSTDFKAQEISQNPRIDLSTTELLTFIQGTHSILNGYHYLTSFLRIFNEPGLKSTVKHLF